MARIDALVVAFHGDAWLDRCVQFVFGEDPATARVLIADNFGNSSVGSLVDGQHVVSLPLAGPLGFAAANNEALAKSGSPAEFICFLNQDTQSTSGWLSRVAIFMARNPDIGALTPLIATYEGDGWDPNFRTCAKDLDLAWDDDPQPEHEAQFFDVPEIPAAAMVARADLLWRIGAFDPLYGSYYEDYDLCQRILTAGYRVGIWTGAVVAHFSGSATRTAAEKRRRERMIVRNRVIYRVRWGQGPRLVRLIKEILFHLPRLVARRLLNRAASKPYGVLLGGYWDALREIRRLVSERHDRFMWQRYLADIGWPRR